MVVKTADVVFQLLTSAAERIHGAFDHSKKYKVSSMQRLFAYCCIYLRLSLCTSSDAWRVRRLFHSCLVKLIDAAAKRAQGRAITRIAFSCCNVLNICFVMFRLLTLRLKIFTYVWDFFCEVRFTRSCMSWLSTSLIASCILLYIPGVPNQSDIKNHMPYCVTAKSHIIRMDTLEHHPISSSHT